MLAIASMYLTTLTLAVSQGSDNEYVIKHADDYVKVVALNPDHVELQKLTDWINGVNQQHFYNDEPESVTRKPSIHLKLRIQQYDEN